MSKTQQRIAERRQIVADYCDAYRAHNGQRPQIEIVPVGRFRIGGSGASYTINDLKRMTQVLRSRVST